MQCPKCKTERPMSTRGEAWKDGAAIKQRFRCNECGHSPTVTVDETVQSVVDPMADPTNDLLFLDGTSTLVDMTTGEGKLQWIKLKAERKKQLERILETITTRAQFIPPKRPTPSPTYTSSREQLALYGIGDAHIGMYATLARAGGDWNCEIAEEIMTGVAERLVEAAPATDHALILNVGDWYHSDNMDNKTRRSGNALDVDGYWSDVIQVGIRIMEKIIDLALKKHKHVTVINTIGNHDEHCSQWLAITLNGIYRNEPRVEVPIITRGYYYFQFGATLLGFTHGHLAKPADLGEIMVKDCERIWSETKKRYWITGHVHHTFKQYRICSVESICTLATRDAWHDDEGYRSEQQMVCIVYDCLDGEKERHTRTPGDLINERDEVGEFACGAVRLAG